MADIRFEASVVTSRYYEAEAPPTDSIFSANRRLRFAVIPVAALTPPAVPGRQHNGTVMSALSITRSTARDQAGQRAAESAQIEGPDDVAGARFDLSVLKHPTNSPP
jgi:hypothetical protein